MTPEEIAAKAAADAAAAAASAARENEDDDQDEDTDHDDQGQDGDDDVQAELVKLKERNKFLEERAEKDRARMKKSYAKANEVKAASTGSVSREEVIKIMQEQAAETTFLTAYPDSIDLLPKIKEAQAKGLSIQEAYALVKGQQRLDPGFRSQQRSGSVAYHGEPEQPPTDDPIFSQGPEIARDYSKK